MSDVTDEIGELYRAARTHSAAGEFSHSLPLWERLVALAPEHWGYVVDLIHDLRQAGRGEEADELHERAVSRFPGEFWVVFHWALAAWCKNDYVAAEQRSVPLLGLLQDLPPHKREQLDRHACWLLGCLTMQRHAFEEAASYFQRACRSAPEDLHLAEQLRRAKHYGRIAASFGTPPLPSGALRAAADYAVLVINLDRDVERLRQLCHRFRDSPVELVRVPGVYGSYLPRIALQNLCRHAGTASPGAAGCLLAHVKAWETIVARDFAVCLILEDDAMPMVNLPHRFASLGIPADFDLCFVNGRMEPLLDPHAAKCVETVKIFDPIDAFTTRPTNYNAPGTDGYFISAAGAHKLLAFVERDGFGGDVDWRLVKYSVAKGASQRLPPESTARAVLAQMDSLPNERLRAFTMYPSLIAHVAGASSRIEETLRG